MLGCNIIFTKLSKEYTFISVDNFLLKNTLSIQVHNFLFGKQFYFGEALLKSVLRIQTMIERRLKNKYLFLLESLDAK